MISETFARLGAAASHTAMWIAVGVLTGHAHAADGMDQAVNQEAIVITLPVFVVSICSTAAFTWTIAKWDNIRTRKVDDLERRINEMLEGKEEKHL